MDDASWFTIKNIDRIDSPALMIHLERVKANLEKAIEIIGKPALLRPHVKTSKIPEVCQLMIDAGVTRFKAATIAECEMLGMIGAPDVLMAYQPYGPKLKRLISLIKQFGNTHFSCLVDNEQSARDLADTALENQVKLSVYIDLNIGMNRTGAKPESAASLAALIDTFPSLLFEGLHAYDGHIYDTDVELRRSRCLAAMDPGFAIQAEYETSAGRKITMILGSTPTFAILAPKAQDHFENSSHHGRMECSPGTFIFWDAGYSRLLPDLPFETAAVLATRVVSIVDAQTICTDLGHKSVASEMPIPRMQLQNLDGGIQKSHSEEHMTVTVSNSKEFHPGDCIYCVPVHVCPTVALYEKVYVVENNEVTGEWKTVARDRYITI